MLEVNDFDAVRISLASPEKIRSWSYGEVTKPETINYRTLKPEKDGLFCERIFGPTKDWECYCGKYKRVRFKGIVCDKCGVEVARAKVRRERMGHIELASPVSHIWFVKGTPSRIGLLLDKSPRELERVLYFASYIVIGVDEEARTRALATLEEEMNVKLARGDRATREHIEQLDAALNEQADTLNVQRAAELARIDERAESERAEIRERAQALLDTLNAQKGTTPEEAIAWDDDVLVPAGAMVNQERIDVLADLAEQRLQLAEARAASDRQDVNYRFDADIEQKRHQTQEERDSLFGKQTGEGDKLRDEYEAQRKELEDVKALNLLTEGQYRELQDRYGHLHIFKAGMGAEAVREIIAAIELDDLRDQLRNEIRNSPGSGQRRKKATKRLRVVEAFRRSGNRPEWMILTVLPVLPPDLRPMVQLDGGRFATSDLNDLYRRVINRNNRLRRLLDLGAPEIIIRNEKRMLQEAVDSLIDNGRRGRAVSGSSNHKLKSLSDMLKGKQGRFRQNLLGKRVDYSGRSVIVVGPTLKLHQCGLPKKMALELFKPFVMRRLVDRQFAHNIKSAKRLVERQKPEVWDVLEEVVKGHPVLLNRAPTLHRLGIQAFEPTLIDGSAIQIHPLVCAAFGADFDGDQMAVHVPLSKAAQDEARTLMLSVYNLLSPSSGEPIVAPSLDMVLGCYYMTVDRPGARGEGRIFYSAQDAQLAYDLDQIDLQAIIQVRMPVQGGSPGETELVTTTVGRVIFNEILPPSLGYRNYTMDKKLLKGVVADCYEEFGTEKTAELVDDIKRMGFRFATRSGITIAISDIQRPPERQQILDEADERVERIQREFRRGLITEEERYQSAIEIWTEARDQVTEAVKNSLDPYGSIYMMTTSGAKGNIQQLTQMAAMRGLMAAPNGRIIDLPIKSSFRDGLTVLEYFISTHGARKGLADTAIRTADSGYLTRRLIDVAQDVIVLEEDCGTTSGVTVLNQGEQGVIVPFRDRIAGRYAAHSIADPSTGEILVERNEEIDADRAKDLESRGVAVALVRSPLTCEARRGVCQFCYGRSLARGRLVEIGEAVGIIAAESIGEPGTQLTMRTFHTGGVAGQDITSGLPRVEELFEARVPKGQAVISEIDGVVEVLRYDEQKRVKIVSHEIYDDRQDVPSGWEISVATGDPVDLDTVIARNPESGEDMLARLAGVATVEEGAVVVRYEDRDEREYPVLAGARLRVNDGDRVSAGDLLTEGAANPQDILRVKGKDAAQQYLVDEVQKVYRSQGVTINDKHIEIITRQMLRKVRIDTSGDTDLLPGDLVDRNEYEEINARVLAEGGEPATAQTVLLGVTKASLNTDSFLAAASFQETTRVLTEAAIQGSTDKLVGLKENVIIGKLIPAGSGAQARRELARKRQAAMAALARPTALEEVPLDGRGDEEFGDLLDLQEGLPIVKAATATAPRTALEDEFGADDEDDEDDDIFGSLGGDDDDDDDDDDEDTAEAPAGTEASEGDAK